MNHSKLYIAIAFILLTSFAGQAQDDVKFTADAPKVVEVGEYFRLTYTLNTKGENFTGPRIPDFTYSGPMVSTNMSTQIINGKVSQNTTYTYTYTMQSSAEGKYTIPPAVVKVKGKKYSSNSVAVEVVKASPARQKQPNSQTNPSSSNTISDEDLFVRINLDKKNVYKGEQILATIKVYTRVNLARFGDIDIPAFQGFWSQEIKIPDQISLVRENFNGKIYNVGTIKKSILVPQQTGDINIDPFELECYVNVQARNRSLFDDFFGSYQTVKKQLVSPPVKVHVKNLPAGAPANFSGAVGQFSIQSAVNKTALKADEALNLKVTISGNGNFSLIDAPKIEFPPDFEVYDPKQTNNYRTSEQGINGHKVFEFLAIPRYGGEYDIPAAVFSYFDPAAGQYKKLTTQAYHLTVEKGANSESGPIISRSTGTELRVLGQDIRYIKTGKIKLTNPGNLIPGKTWFYLSYLIVILLTVLAIILLVSLQKKRADVAAIRTKQASKVGQKKLKRAREALHKKNKEVFLNETLKAIWGYLGDKLLIDPSSYRRDLVEEYFIRYELDQSVLTDLFELLDRCEYTRYAPGGQGHELDKILTDASRLINDLELILGKKKRNA